MSRANNRAYARRNAPKKKARDAVKHAIEQGKMTRQPCEKCGDPDTQAHHDDYSKPLDVRWLCYTHHCAEHGAVAA